MCCAPPPPSKNKIKINYVINTFQAFQIPWFGSRAGLDECRMTGCSRRAECTEPAVRIQIDESRSTTNHTGAKIGEHLEMGFRTVLV